MSETATPKPRVVSEVCSLCGLDWKLHGKKPTTETCIKLLLDEVSALNAQLAVRRPYSFPVPYPQPYPVPIRPWYPYWSGTYLSNISGGQTQINYASHTPQVSNATPKALTVRSTT